MIKIENLRKEYFHRGPDGKTAAKTAVNGLDLTIGDGEVFGLLGPNGAGKTTTIRMLTTLTAPTAGKIYYDDLDLAVDGDAAKRLFGVVPQNLNFDQDLTVWENMELHARLYHIPAGERRRRINDILEFMELTDVINDGVRRLSGGMKRRLLIARAVVHDPKVLFMDEPTVALDPQVRRRIWDLIRQMARRGTTILLTTHYIEEAAALCDRVAMMAKGNIVAINTPDGFLAAQGRYVAVWEGADGTMTRFFATGADAEDYISTLTVKAAVRPANLEDVFVELTTRRR